MDVLPSDTLFMQFDVNDCYASFADEYLVRRMPVPAAMTRSTLLLEGWVIIDRAHKDAVGRRGLPQGSAASSYVAEMVIADVLQRAADPLRSFVLPITYSDNVGGLLPPGTDVAALEASLRDVFLRHPAGPLSRHFSAHSVIAAGIPVSGPLFCEITRARSRVSSSRGVGERARRLNDAVFGR